MQRMKIIKPPQKNDQFIINDMDKKVCCEKSNPIRSPSQSDFLVNISKHQKLSNGIIQIPPVV